MKYIYLILFLFISICAQSQAEYYVKLGQEQSNSGGGGVTWSLASATDSGNSYSFGGGDRGITVSADEGTIYSNSTSTMWDHTPDWADISSTTSNGNSVSFTGNTTGVGFSDDGTVVLYAGNGEVVSKGTLSTAFDISSTWTSQAQSWTIPSGSTIYHVNPYADDAGFLLTDDSQDDIREHTTDADFDFTTVTENSTFTTDINPRVFQWNDDETVAMIAYVGGNVKLYSATTAGDITTLGTADETLNVWTLLGTGTTLTGAYISNDGTVLLVLDLITNLVYQIDL